MNKRMTSAIFTFSLFTLAIFTMTFTSCKFGVMKYADIKKLEDELYFLDYNGDYGFEKFIEMGGAATDEEMGEYLGEFLNPFSSRNSNGDEIKIYAACSTISAKSPDGKFLAARNYDWDKCGAMIVYTHGTKAYSSISTCCYDFMGFGDDFKPEGFTNQFKACAAIYLPLDGLNEKGLFIADLMAGDDEETHQNSKTLKLTTVSAIRYILDYAADVDEAILLLESIDMNSSIGSAHHFAISDANGKSVVVEYVDNKMIVTPTQILTNHYLCDEKKLVGTAKTNHTLERFEIMEKAYSEHNGIFTTEQITDTIKSVAESNFASGTTDTTEWTTVYNKTDLSIDFYRRENFKKCYTYKLK